MGIKCYTMHESTTLCWRRSSVKRIRWPMTEPCVRLCSMTSPDREQESQLPFPWLRHQTAREQRNHDLKCESDCVRIGIGIKIFMNRGRFCERSFRWVFVIHTTIERKHSFYFGTSFHSPCLIWKLQMSTKETIHQNMSIALQFSYQFAIFMSVCNFYISLQFSCFGV